MEYILLPRSAFLLKLFLVLPSLNTYLVEILITYHFQGGKISPNYFYKGENNLKRHPLNSRECMLFLFFFRNAFYSLSSTFFTAWFLFIKTRTHTSGLVLLPKGFFFFSPDIFYTLIILLIFLNYIFYVTLKSVISFISSFPHLNILKIFFINLHHFFSCGS